MPIKVDVITPERLAFSDVVDFIAAPGVDGEIGILPHHAPLLSRLGVGELRLKKGNETNHLAISGGFLEVQLGSHVSIFAETAELSHEIDSERARLAAERAQGQLKQGSQLKDIDLAQAEASLNRALLRLKVAKLRQGYRGPKPEEGNPA